MSYFFRSPQCVFPRGVICSLVAAAFILSLISPSMAQVLPAGNVAGLPAPGQAIWLTPAFQPPVLRGMTVHPENPLRFDFIVDRGQNRIENEQLKGESEKLIKYFLAAMTIPDKDSWVNLSPYEKDRIIPDALGQTEMGRQMLEQDYILKQLSASLTNPDKELGQEFWNEVRSRAQKQFGTTEIPLSTFNKVWITPDSATVVEKDGFAYITESKLKVMLDQDYLAMDQNMASPKAPVGDPQSANGFPTKTLGNDTKDQKISQLSSDVFREMILPKLIEEVNTGKNFAQTRQVYQSVILSAWYKKALKDSLLGRIYANQSKVEGVESDVKDIKQKVYEQYLEAFKKGAYNVIKEESHGDDLIPRKYFSGGQTFAELDVKIERGTFAENQASSAIANAGDQIAIVAASAAETPDEVTAQANRSSSAVSSTKVYQNGKGSIDAATVIGGRSEQKDDYFIEYMPGIGSVKAVMDGHGIAGTQITAKVKRDIEKIINDSWIAAGRYSTKLDSRYKETLRLTFLKLDDAIKKDKSLSAGQSGTTLSLVIIPEDNSAAYVGSLGDSPILILDKEGTPVLSPLHNAGYNLKERNEAIARGAVYQGTDGKGLGFISPNIEPNEDGTENKQIQLTRGLGDTDLKIAIKGKNGQIRYIDLLKRQPSVYSVDLGPKSLVVLASDGYADFGHNEAGSTLKILNGIEAGKSAKDLINESLQDITKKNKSAPNTTLVIWKAPRTDQNDQYETIPEKLIKLDMETAAALQSQLDKAIYGRIDAAIKPGLIQQTTLDVIYGMSTLTQGQKDYFKINVMTQKAFDFTAANRLVFDLTHDPKAPWTLENYDEFLHVYGVLQETHKLFKPNERALQSRQNELNAEAQLADEILDFAYANMGPEAFNQFLTEMAQKVPNEYKATLTEIAKRYPASIIFLKPEGKMELKLQATLNHDAILTIARHALSEVSKSLNTQLANVQKDEGRVSIFARADITTPQGRFESKIRFELGKFAIYLGENINQLIGERDQDLEQMLKDNVLGFTNKDIEAFIQFKNWFARGKNIPDFSDPELFIRYARLYQFILVFFKARYANYPDFQIPQTNILDTVTEVLGEQKVAQLLEIKNTTLADLHEKISTQSPQEKYPDMPLEILALLVSAAQDQLFEAREIGPGAVSSSSAIDRGILDDLKISPAQQNLGRQLAGDLFRLGISSEVLEKVIADYQDRLVNRKIFKTDGGIVKPNHVLSEIIKGIDDLKAEDKLELQDLFEMYIQDDPMVVMAVLYVAFKDLNVLPLTEAGPLVSYILSILYTGEDMLPSDFLRIVVSAEAEFRKALALDRGHNKPEEILLEVIMRMDVEPLRKQVIISILSEAFSQYVGAQVKGGALLSRIKKWMISDKTAAMQLSRIVAHPAFFQKFHDHLRLEGESSLKDLPQDLSPTFERAIADLGKAVVEKMSLKDLDIKIEENLRILQRAFQAADRFLQERGKNAPPLSYKKRRDLLERLLFNQGHGVLKNQIILAGFIMATDAFEKTELGQLLEDEFEKKTGHPKGDVFEYLFTAINITPNAGAVASSIIASSDQRINTASIVSASSGIMELRNIILLGHMHGDEAALVEAFEHLALMAETNDVEEKEKHRKQFIKDLDLFFKNYASIIASLREDIEIIKKSLFSNPGIKKIGVEYLPGELQEAEKTIANGADIRRSLESQLRLAAGVQGDVKEKVDQLSLFTWGPVLYMKERRDPLLDGVKIVALDQGDNKQKSITAENELLTVAHLLESGVNSELRLQIRNAFDKIMRTLDYPTSLQVQELTDILVNNQLESKLPLLEELLNTYREMIKYLITERDRVVAENIIAETREGEGMLAILGAGHTHGIADNLEKQGIAIDEIHMKISASSAIFEVPAGVGVVKESASDVGGIDFDPSKLNLQIKRDGRGVALPLPQQDLQNIDIKGLYPVIINIMPVNATTLPILSQLNVTPVVEALSKS